MTTTFDTTFDFRSDANGGDPDKTSPTLRKFHKFLWSKPLPGGPVFGLDDTYPGAYLHHESALGEFFLSSDSVIPTYRKWKRFAHIIDQVSIDEMDNFLHLGYTIGGMMIYPSNVVDGKQTINGARGFNSQICDRLDLTLECIRRYYKGEGSPLFDTFLRYKSFFDLFQNFQGYVDFFFLQDLVSRDYSRVRFFIPFDNFNSSPLPSDLENYVTYKDSTIAFIQKRNARISEQRIATKQI